MVGGGIFKLIPGQITDDSEMAMCLMYGLLEGKGSFDLDKIVYYYYLWMLSNPVDIGKTTKNALNVLLEMDINEGIEGWAEKCRKAAFEMNEKSESNGSLMRIAPLALWCWRLHNIDDLEIVVRKEVSLTHPNNLIQEACICYCIAIRYLLKNHGDTKGAYNEVQEWINHKSKSNISEWWKEVKEERFTESTIHVGWARNAWTSGFIYLKRHDASNLDFLNIIKEVLRRGGDTDTNACIVGMMLGAILGYNNLTKQCPKQIQILLNYDPKKAYNNRPNILMPTLAFNKIEDLLQMAPIYLIQDKI